MGLAVKMIFDTSGLVTGGVSGIAVKNFEYPYVAD